MFGLRFIQEIFASNENAISASGYQNGTRSASDGLLFAIFDLPNTYADNILLGNIWESNGNNSRSAIVQASQMAGKKVLITGATDGIGLHTAKQLAKMGADVLVHGR